MNCFKRSNVLLLCGALLCVVAVAVCAPAEPITFKNELDAMVFADWTAKLDKIFSDLRQPTNRQEYSDFALKFYSSLNELADTISQSREYHLDRGFQKAVNDLFERKYDYLRELDHTWGPRWGFVGRLVTDFNTIVEKFKIRKY